MTFREILERRAERDGNKPFIYFRDQVVGYATLNKNVNKAAHFFRELGVRKGDHVCLFLPNCPEFIYLWFGLAKIGGVMVPLDVNLRGEGLRYIIHHCDAKWIVVHERLYDAYAFVEKDLPGIEQRIWHGEHAPAAGNFYSLSHLMEAAEEKAPPAVEIKDEDPLELFTLQAPQGHQKVP